MADQSADALANPPVAPPPPVKAVPSWYDGLRVRVAPFVAAADAVAGAGVAPISQTLNAIGQEAKSVATDPKKRTDFLTGMVGSGGEGPENLYEGLRVRKAPEPTIEHESLGDRGGIVRLKAGDKEVGRVRYTTPQEERPAAGAITAAHVDPEYRGQGHAQTMMLRAADELQAKGVKSMTSDLQGTTNMDAARAWDGLTAKGHPVEKIPSKAGSAGYTMDLTKPRPGQASHFIANAPDGVVNQSDPKAASVKKLVEDNGGVFRGMQVNQIGDKRIGQIYIDVPPERVGGKKNVTAGVALNNATPEGIKAAVDAMAAKHAPIPTKLHQNAAVMDNMNDPATRLTAARHEAAHAVISEALNPGSVNMTGLTSAGGVTDIQPPAGKTTVGQLTPDEIRDMVATSYAGGLSEPGGTTIKHASGDQAARAQVLAGRGTSEFLQAPELQAAARARVTALLADPAIQKNIDTLAGHISTRGKLSGADVRTILKIK